MNRSLARHAFGPFVLAIALLRDLARFPLTWGTALLCGTVLLASALLLPAADAVARAQLTVSFVSGMAFLLSCAAGAVLPAYLLSSKRQEKLIAAWSTCPAGAFSSFAGTCLASFTALLLWVLFLLVVSSAVTLAVLARVPHGHPLAPRREYFPSAVSAGLLPEGQPATFRFSPLNRAELPDEGLEGVLDLRLRLARPDATDFGSPVRLTLLEEGGANRVLAEVSSLPGRRLRFSVPAGQAAKGAVISVRFGPSPFEASVPEGGLRLLGRRSSLARSALHAGACALLAALLVACFSACGASFLSLPLAVLFGVWIFTAGFLSAPANEALLAWEHMGMMKAKEGIPDLPAWFGPFRAGFDALVTLLPDLSELSRASELARARHLESRVLLAGALRTILYGLPALLAGLLIFTRREQG